MKNFELLCSKIMHDDYQNTVLDLSHCKLNSQQFTMLLISLLSNTHIKTLEFNWLSLNAENNNNLFRILKYKININSANYQLNELCPEKNDSNFALVLQNGSAQGANLIHKIKM